MNVNLKQIFNFLIVLCIGILCAFFCFRLFDQVQKDIKKNAETIFKKAVLVDKKIRITPYLSRSYCYKDSGQTSGLIKMRTQDSIVYTMVKENMVNESDFDDKTYIAEHLFLLYENPIQVRVLDSLFHSMLEQAGIPATTATIYSVNNKTTSYSQPDSLFYSSAIRLNTVTIGGITLQGFVKVPFVYLLTKEKELLISISMIGFVCIILLLWFAFRKKTDPVVMKELVNTSPELHKINDDLLFNKQIGTLIYHKEKVIQLKEYQLKTFTLLLDNLGNNVSYELLSTIVWNRQDISSDSIKQTITRLRKSIKDIPELTIESARGQGYKLNLKTQ